MFVVGAEGVTLRRVAVEVRSRIAIADSDPERRFIWGSHHRLGHAEVGCLRAAAIEVALAFSRHCADQMGLPLGRKSVAEPTMSGRCYWRVRHAMRVFAGCVAAVAWTMAACTHHDVTVEYLRRSRFLVIRAAVDSTNCRHSGD